MSSNMISRCFLALLSCLFLCGLALPAHAQGVGMAYKKEYAYLQAQVQSLTSRLSELEGESERKVSEGRAGVDRLQGRVLSLQAQAEALEAELHQVTLKAEDAAGEEDVLAGTLEQAHAALGELGQELPPLPESSDAALGAARRAEHFSLAIEKMLPLLEASSQVHIKQGSFFGPTGAKLNGKVAFLGQIAAYGVSGSHAAALAPAGEGRLKVWGVEASQSAAGVIQGKPPKQLGIFLFESLKRNVEPKREKSWAEFMAAGGPTGWVIVGLGVLGAVLVMCRLVILGVLGRGAGGLVERIVPLVRQGQVEGARRMLGHTRSSAGRVLAQLLDVLERSAQGREDAMVQALLYEAPRLERFGTMVLVFAASAPLLGLLGTVTGMISTFDIITEFGTGDPKMLSGGISEALITTQLGLVVAIPLLLLGNVTSGLAHGIQTKLERSALRLLSLAQGPPSAEAER